MEWPELWITVSFTGLLVGFGVLMWFIGQPPLRLTDVPRCRDCNYDLSATPRDKRCPECAGWDRTRAIGLAGLRRDRLVKSAALWGPPLTCMLAALFTVRPAWGEAATVLGYSAASALPISFAAFQLRHRTTARELAVLTVPAVAAVVLTMVSTLPDGAHGAICCLPISAIGPAGLGAGVGGLVIWLHSECAARR